MSSGGKLREGNHATVWRKRKFFPTYIPLVKAEMDWMVDNLSCCRFILQSREDQIVVGGKPCEEVHKFFNHGTKRVAVKAGKNWMVSPFGNFPRK